MVNVMQITLGKRGDYAIRAVLDLSRAYGHGRRKTRQIAEAMNIPPKFLSQILADLVRAGILTATAGQDGGYELARQPAEISLLDVIMAIEGPPALPECLLRGIPCGTDGFCDVHDAWMHAQHSMTTDLAHTSFDQFIRGRHAGRSRAGTATA